MSTKYKILDILKSSPNKYVSGEDLSLLLNVSRTSVWKAVKSLRTEGYNIVSKTNGGYSLIDSTSDVFTEHELVELLKTKVIAKNIKFFKSIPSTNEYAKSIASNLEGKQTAVVALEQTNGQGAESSIFYSPKNDGIYITFVLNLNIKVNQINLVSDTVLLCVKNAIKKTCGINVTTLSPNKILYNDKKVGGVLTQMLVEASTNTDGAIQYIISGIGINVNNSCFPEQLSDSLTSLKLCCNHSVSRLELTKNLINELDKIISKSSMTN